MKNRLSILIIFVIFLYLGCASTQAPVEEAPPEEPVVEEPVPEVVEEPVQEEPEVIINEETGFEISAELYEQTFDEIKMLVDKLNGIISDRNYEKWKLYLSDEYIKNYNDSKKLKQISEQSQILSDNDIVLKNLKDYFEWVVVPSRSKASADDIVFLDDTHLVVYMLIKEKRTILYQLEKIEEKWLISVW